MSRTVTALYDSKAEAEAARQRLESQVDVEGRARIIDKSSFEGGQGSSGFGNVALSNEDRQLYNEGINRGGFMLCAEVDGGEDADQIVSILEQTSSVDMDERESSWRKEGWTGDESQRNFGQKTSGQQGDVVEEEHIPLVEEQLRVGKREVERGGARVRSYVEERPVSEQVNLREEHVSIERRPVDQKLSAGDLSSDNDLMRERTVEMRETAEEAVVGKEARVREELVMKKTAEEHSENIEDTVQVTKVDIEEGSSFQNRDRDKV